MFVLPSFQDFVVAALGLNDFVCVGINIALKSTLATLPFSFLSLSTSSLRIQELDDVFKSHAVLFHQLAKFVFKLEFCLQAFVSFELVQMYQLFGDLTFKGTVLSGFRHARLLLSKSLEYNSS
ncbi:hypothetical protein PPL19_04055 [Pseudomonas psychrotolerans L19]|nr:hypothetical protein PPL19_04055 [Pseudomonas psychrotolerans L19]